MTAVYECPTCGARQPVTDVDAEDPPAVIGNTTCQGKYGGCLRMTRLELVPEATWDPAEWDLRCPMCGYETVAWGSVGFADSTRWTCPDCETAMRVGEVRQVQAVGETEARGETARPRTDEQG